MSTTDPDAPSISNRWHHCGRCDQFFQASDSETCPHCQSSPVIDPAEMAFLEAEAKPKNDEQNPTSETSSVSSKRRASRSKRVARSGRKRHRKKNALVIFVVAWVSMLALLLVWISSLRENESSSAPQDDLKLERSERQRQLKEAYPVCKKRVTSFMMNFMPESKVQYVFQPNEVVSKLGRNSNPVPMLGNPNEIGSEYFDFFETPTGEMAIQSRWKTIDGEQLEIVFYQNDEGAWVIDWENLVRWSDASWSIFLTQEEETIKEFRLFARRPATDSGGSVVTDSIRLLEPDAWNPGKAERQSPVIPVDPDSETGRILEAAFQQRERDEGVFGTRLHQDDPTGMIRLRARIRREPGERAGKPKFHLDEILACHWLSLDELGVEVSEETPED